MFVVQKKKVVDKDTGQIAIITAVREEREKSRYLTKSVDVEFKKMEKRMTSSERCLGYYFCCSDKIPEKLDLKEKD